MTNTMKISDQVVEFLENTQSLSEYYEETALIVDRVNLILNDMEDDKLGRIRDVFNDIYIELATFVEDNHDEIPYASWLYNEMVTEELLEEEE